MKNESDYTIIYDDQCPMCIWYTGKFVDMGTLKPENRVGFGEAQTELMDKVIFEKATRGIPLIDNKNQEVTYGFDSMLKLIAARFPMLTALLRFPLTRWIFSPLYSWISYNRRVIAGAKSKAGNYDSKPPLHYAYRMAYLLFCLCGILLPGVFIFITSRQLCMGSVLTTLCFVATCYSGFILHALLINAFGGKDKYELFGHFFTSNFIGMLPLGIYLFTLPWIATFLPENLLIYFPIACVVLTDLDYYRRYRNGHVPMKSNMMQGFQVLFSIVLPYLFVYFLLFLHK
jgi:predicted DCC family thiol-disulfide oxidoreductase YuxK